jgi:hypothetical protein
LLTPVVCFNFAASEIAFSEKRNNYGLIEKETAPGRW